MTVNTNLSAANWSPEQTLLARGFMTGPLDEYYCHLDRKESPLKILQHYLEEIKQHSRTTIANSTTAELLMRCFYKIEDKARQSHLRHHTRHGDGWAIDGADCKEFYDFDPFTPLSPERT